MGGLTILSAALACLCAALLIQKILLNRRIRRLTEKLDNFLSGREEMLDIALGEDPLARLENEIADLQQAFRRETRLRARECSRTNALTADISHQLKTPLTTLRLYTEMDGAAHMDASLEQIQRMETLIQALLRLERLCADGYTFSFVETDVADIIRERWQSLRTLFPKKKLTIEGSACICCDKRWMGEAFLNLLKNACEHTAEDGAVWVCLERTEAAFFCTLEDNGGGVPEGELPKLFRRFYRAEHNSPNGAGIGLAIVEAIIRRHHGTITAENGAFGLKMTISIPLFDLNQSFPCEIVRET